METVATSSSTVSDYIFQMKQDLYQADYGKIGIVFTVHDGQVTYVQQIKEKQYQLTKSVDDTG